MFTGIIEELGTRRRGPRTRGRGPAHRARGHRPGGRRLGDSIAVNGCCLTVTERTDDTWTADVMQTLDKTSLGVRRGPGQPRAPVTADKRLGGHIVQGHVDGVWHRRQPHPQRAPWRSSLTAMPTPGALPRRTRVDHRRRLSPHRGRGRVDRFTVSLIPETRPYHARDPTARRPGQPRGRRDALGTPGAPAAVHGDVCHPGAGMTAPVRRPPDRRGPPDHLARDRRQRLRFCVGHRRACAAGVGLAGRHRWQRLAVHRLRRRHLRRPAQQPLFGQAGRQVFFIPTSIYGWYRWSEQRRLYGGGVTRPRSTPLGDLLGSGCAAWSPRLSASWWRSGRSAGGAGWPRRAGTTGATPGSSSGRSGDSTRWPGAGNDFWLAWIAVDLVGKCRCLAPGYYPLGDPHVTGGGRASPGSSPGARHPATPRRRSPPRPRRWAGT